MLKLLQPGIEPLGQFDLEDDDMELVRGGEVAVFDALDPTDAYAADVDLLGGTGAVYLKLTDGSPLLKDTADAITEISLHGLVDDGTTDGSPDNTNYGTSFGTVIGVTAGQATGVGALAGRAVVVGPSTLLGSGKATLWTKPGLYGVTEDGWETSAGDFDSVVVNDPVGPLEIAGAERGKLALVSGAAVYPALISVGPVIDPSLVSTTTTAVGDAAVVEHQALYLVGVR